MNLIRKMYASINALKERRTMLHISAAIIVSLMVAFGVILFNVTHIITNLHSQIEHQVEDTASSVENTISGYAGLCDLIGANETVSHFSAYSTYSDSSRRAIDGREVMKILCAQVSLYGKHVNNLAVYFPESDTVITMARYLTGDEVSSFMDSDVNAIVKAYVQSGLQITSSHTDTFLQDSSHNFIIRYTLTSKGYPVYVVVDFNIRSHIQSLLGADSEFLVLLRDPLGHIISNRDAYSAAQFESLFDAANQKKGFHTGGADYYAQTVQTRLAGVDALAAAPIDAVDTIRINCYFVLGLTAALVLTMVYYLGFSMNRSVFKPLETFRNPENTGSMDVESLVQQVNTDMNALTSSVNHYRRERKQMLPLALARIVNRLLDEDDPAQQQALAYSCLTMANADDAPYYAIYGMGCTADPNHILETKLESGSQSRMALLQFLIDNVLQEFVEATVAPIRKDWLLVLIPCSAEGDIAQIEDANAKLQEFFQTQFGMTLETTAVTVDNGVAYFADYVKQIRNNTLFLEFWGQTPAETGEHTEKNSFLYYCNTIRRLLDRVNPDNYEDTVTMFNSVLNEAFPPDMDSVLQARNRMQALGSIAVSTIREKYQDNPEFLLAVNLESLQWCTSLSVFREEFQRLLAALCKTQPDTEDQVGTTNGRMAEIKEYIVAHYTDNEMNVTSIAKQFNYSVPYLSRSFKDVYNINLLEFIQRMRVSLAKELLSEHSVKSTASQTGFWDEQALVRTFKKYEGITPAEYKKLTSKDAN